MTARCLLVLTALALAAPAQADLTVEYRFDQITRYFGPGEAGGRELRKQETDGGIHKLWITKDKLVTENHTKQRQLYDFAAKVRTSMRLGQRDYQTQPFARIEAQQRQMLEKLAQTRTRMEAQLKLDLPDHIRAQMDRAMKLLATPVYEVAKVGTETFLEREVVRYKVLRDKLPYMEIWCCEALISPEHAQMVQISMPPQGGVRARFAEIKGIWLKWTLAVDRDNLEMRQTVTASRVATDAVDPTLFAVPEGFRKFVPPRRPAGGGR